MTARLADLQRLRPSFDQLAGPGLHRPTVLRVAAVDGACYLLLLALAVRLGPALGGLDTTIAFGAGLVLGLASRGSGAVLGAARYRADHPLAQRRDLLPSVLAGAALAWLGVTLLSLPAGAAAALAPAALLQLPRWLAESAAGVLLVTPERDA